MSMEKLPQHDIEAEQSVLGSILINSDSYFSIDWLKPRDFFREKNLWVFQSCVELINKGVACDQLTVSHNLALNNKLDALGGAAYLSSLVANVASPVHIVYYAEIIKRCSQYRSLGTLAYEIEQVAFNGGLDFEESFNKVLHHVVALNKSGKNKIKTPLDRYERACDTYQRYFEGTLSRTHFGINTLDKLGGMADGEIIILCGETKMGKSTIAKQISDFVSNVGPVLYFTGEMVLDQWNQREVAQILKQPMRKLADVDYIKNNFGTVMEGVKKIKNSKVYTVCGSVSPQEIYGYAVNIPDLKLIVVDYLQLIRGVTADYKSTSLASSEIARTAKELEIPILVLSQLSRENAKKPEDKKPWMQRLKDSGNIENDCDWALNISRNQNAPLGSQESKEAILSVGYHRQGGERIIVPLLYDYNEQIYMEVPTEKIQDYKWYNQD